jgi:TnpA family transposase
MVQPAVALKTGTATAEALLKRLHASHGTHPPYQALAEWGKVEQTLYGCASLSSVALRHAVAAGWKVVERWHEAHAVLWYGWQGVLATTQREQHEITPLFYEPVHPYGLFTLARDRPSRLEAA